MKLFLLVFLCTSTTFGMQFPRKSPAEIQQQLALQEELIRAVSCRDKDWANSAISQGANVNYPDKIGFTPLWIATANNDNEMVTWLLNHHAIPDLTLDWLSGDELKKGAINRNPPLMVALRHSHPHLAILLLNRGANPNRIVKEGHDDDNETPLLLASRNGYLEVVKLLLEKGAADTINVATRYKKDTPLGAALRMKHDDIAFCLVKAGAESVPVPYDH